MYKQGLLFVLDCVKWIWHFVVSLVTVHIPSWASNRWFSFLVPGICGVFYAVISCDFVKESNWYKIPANHDKVQTYFVWCVGLNLFCYAIAAFGRNHSSSGTSGIDSLNIFSRIIGAIVQAKVDRFRRKLESAGNAKDRFKLITHPEEQIKVISRATAEFMKDCYSISESQFDLVIFQKGAVETEWSFLFKFQSWEHRNANDIMAGKSLSGHASRIGESLFFANKFASPEYWASDRDKRKKKGSVYCHPIRIQTPRGIDNYTVTISTYKRQLCNEFDKPSIEATEAFMKEICRRIELELCLLSLLNINS